MGCCVATGRNFISSRAAMRDRSVHHGGSWAMTISCVSFSKVPHVGLKCCVARAHGSKALVTDGFHLEARRTPVSESTFLYFTFSSVPRTRVQQQPPQQRTHAVHRAHAMQTKDEEREKRDFTVDTHAEQGRRARILMIVVVSGQPVGHQKGHKKLQCMSTIRTFLRFSSWAGLLKDWKRIDCRSDNRAPTVAPPCVAH